MNDFNDFFNLVGDYFQNLTNEEQILLGLIAILVFSLGVIVGWIIQSTKTRRYKKELLLLRKDRDEYEVRYRAGEAKQKALAKELETVSREKVAAFDQVQGLKNDLNQREVQLESLRRTNEELTASNQSQATAIATLNERIITLTAQNEQLSAANTGAAAGDALSLSERAKEVEGARTNEHLNAYIATSEDRFQDLEYRIARLARENAELRKPQTNAGASKPYTGHQPVMNPDLDRSWPNGEPLVIRADTTDPGIRTGDQGNARVIVQTTPSVHVPSMKDLSEKLTDDLKLIDNIGPFLQQKLNEVDIYRYDQIAGWTEADIATYTELIGYIPGIIRRDDWVGQARGLAMSEAAVPDRPAPKSTDKPTPEVSEGTTTSLRIVEGIGPKIESILQAGGVTSLSVLAETPTERLQELLDEAGPRFKSQDPKTWPVQAGLAADGKLEELKAWQGELKGGS
jgi:predicted flap endonuclease-1-like 5' DNA nuclease/regulator of replication initiation timing